MYSRTTSSHSRSQKISFKRLEDRVVSFTQWVSPFLSNKWVGLCVIIGLALFGIGVIYSTSHELRISNPAPIVMSAGKSK